MTVIKKAIHLIAGPLAFIFNTSFSTSIFPSLFKNAVITPIHKKGDVTDLNNFRPISLLNNLSKILEKLVAHRISSHLELHNLLVDQQFGFRHGRSTSDAVAHFLQKLDETLTSGQHAIGIFCDLTKAFDCVDHALLLSKLPSFGIGGGSLNWIESYLSNRHQKVKVPTSDPPLNNLTSNISHSVSNSFTLTPIPSPHFSSFPTHVPPSHLLSASTIQDLHSSNGPSISNESHGTSNSLIPPSFPSHSLPSNATPLSPTSLPFSSDSTVNTHQSFPTCSGQHSEQNTHTGRPIPSSSPPISSYTYSSSLQVQAGVPQGSVLGPLLFLLYMNDIISADLRAFLTLFADDTTILVSGLNIADVLAKAAEVMSFIQNWFKTNKLCLNQTKTSYIYFNSPHSSLPHIKTLNLSISPTAEVKFLGLVVDSKLTWKTHIQSLISKLSKAVFAVNSVRRNVSFSTALLSYFSYFHSVMSYAIVYWGYSPEVKSVFRLQKRAVRAVFGFCRRTSCKSIFKDSKILTVYAQVILDSCILIHKISNSLTKHSEVHDHNTRNKNKIIISTNKIMDKSFLKEGIKHYNKLSDEHKQLEPSRFKSILKERLLDLVPYSFDEFKG